MQRLIQAPRAHGRRYLASFAELYRESVSNAKVRAGDPLQGRVVGRQGRRSGSSGKQFYVVDFGLKNEAPFGSREIPGVSTIGAKVALPLTALEDAFNEPVLDYGRRSTLPAVQAERLSLLSLMDSKRAQVVHGRFAAVKRGGASAKALGVDGFVPRHHVVALEKPLVGSYAPFYVLSVRGLEDVSPVISSYGAYLFMLANLVGSDAKWKASGGGSARERIGYLRLLTRLLMTKNAQVRRIMPQSDYRPRGMSKHRTKVAQDRAPGMWLEEIRGKRGKI